MEALFEIKPVDRRFYEQRLRDFLPDRIIDMHTHVWLHRFILEKPADGRSVTWPARVAKDNAVEDLAETYKLMFPGKPVTPLMFGTIDADLNAENGYISECARKTGYPALIFSDPIWTADELEKRIREGGFLGAKSYLSLAPAYLPGNEVRIYDYFPPHQLAVLDRHGWIMMLHIPRPGRLRDPVNLAQMLEIEAKYPEIRVIVAHVGRAYCPEDVGNAFDILSGTRRMMFDISANTNDTVFEQLIKAVGPGRILFGSDLPILRMRMKRICERGTYVNLVPRGLYGDVSGDRNMRDVAPSESDAFTFFMYEELDAFRRAAERTELTRSDIERVFYGNALAVLKEAGWKGD
jgi:predicted TIM-barrel fold metal-dependent hydrolase